MLFHEKSSRFSGRKSGESRKICLKKKRSKRAFFCAFFVLFLLSAKASFFSFYTPIILIKYYNTRARVYNKERGLSPSPYLLFTLPSNACRYKRHVAAQGVIAQSRGKKKGISQIHGECAVLPFQKSVSARTGEG